ncbi:uroporphyrinogen decarboxylase family protein [Candidatus Aerophobetes bacterium]|nr:uroporphyrinogen decarboxylase family protein [Candidatus Aerophobetes bacterium]
MTMTPLERFKVAAKLGVPDEVPVVIFATGHYIAWFAGLEEGEYWQDPVKKFEAQLKLQERFPDVMLYPGIWPDYSVVIEVSAFGCKIKWPRNASPQVSEHVKIDELIEMGPPDPFKDGLMPKALETYKYMMENIPSCYRERYEYLNGWAISLGPVDMAGISLGYDTFFSSMYLNPEKIHRVMEITTETVIRYIKAQEKIGGKLKRYEIADDGIGLISPEHFKEFALPYLRKIFSTFSHGIGILHCDADTSHLLEYIPEVGMNIFNLGPQVDIKAAKEKIGKKVCLMGNIPPIDITGIPASNTLLKGTPEDVERICRYQIEAAKPGGGYILTTGSGTARGTPDKNIEAMIKAAKKYGKY